MYDEFEFMKITETARIGRLSDVSVIHYYTVCSLTYMWLYDYANILSCIDIMRAYV